jgi:hypothetical protein
MRVTDGVDTCEGPSHEELQHALAECRNAFPPPEPGTELEGLWAQAMCDPLSVPAYVKAAAGVKGPDAEARRYDAEQSRATLIPKGVDAGKPEYLHALIDHLLMPPAAMTESHLRRLHNEAAEMLHLLSKRLTRMASTSLGHAMKVEAQASQALTQYNAGSTGQGDAGGVDVSEPLDRIRRCTLGCGELGQCKANAHGVPSECPARNPGVVGRVEGKAE